MKHMSAVESDSVKSARKAKDELHKACERASETHPRDSDRFLVNTQVQSHALLSQGFGTSVPFIIQCTCNFHVVTVCTTLP